MSESQIHKASLPPHERLAPENILSLEELCNTKWLLDKIENQHGIFAIHYPDTGKYVALVPAAIQGSRYILLGSVMDRKTQKFDESEVNIHEVQDQRSALSILRAALTGRRAVASYRSGQRYYYYTLMRLEDPLLKDIPLLEKEAGVGLQQKKNPELKALFNNMMGAGISKVFYAGHSLVNCMRVPDAIEISSNRDEIYGIIEKDGALKGIAVSLRFPGVENVLARVEKEEPRLDRFTTAASLYKGSRVPLLVEKHIKVNGRDPGNKHIFAYFTTAALEALQLSRDEVSQLTTKFEGAESGDDTKTGQEVSARMQGDDALPVAAVG